MERENIDLVLAGVDPGDGDALELLTYVRRKHRDVPVVLLFPRLHPERAKEALRLGAMAVLKYPVPAAELRAAVLQALEQCEARTGESSPSGRDGRCPPAAAVSGGRLVDGDRRDRHVGRSGDRQGPGAAADAGGRDGGGDAVLAGRAAAGGGPGGHADRAGRDGSGGRGPGRARPDARAGPGPSPRPAGPRARAHRQRPVAGGRSSSWPRRSPRRGRRS